MVTVPQALKAIPNIFGKLKSELKFKVLSKGTLIAQFEDTKRYLSIVGAQTTKKKQKSLHAAFKKAMIVAKSSRGVSMLGKENTMILLKMESILKGSAKSKGNGVFGAIDYTNHILLTMCDDIIENMDEIITNADGVTVNDMKVSHALVIGIMESAKMYANYTTDLIGLLTYISSDFVSTYPKYHLKSQVKHFANYMDLLNQSCHTTKKANVVSDIKQLRSNGTDMIMYIDRNSNVSHSSTMVTDVLGFENMFIGMFNLVLKPVAMIGEIYVDSRHRHYANLNDRKKWLENQMAALQMSLDGVDKNDKEYQKVQKIIDYYADKVAKYDKDLDKYYDN